MGSYGGAAKGSGGLKTSFWLPRLEKPVDRDPTSFCSCYRMAWGREGGEASRVGLSLKAPMVDVPVWAASAFSADRPGGGGEGKGCLLEASVFEARVKRRAGGMTLANTPLEALPRDSRAWWGFQRGLGSAACCPLSAPPVVLPVPSAATTTVGRGEIQSDHKL